MLPVRQAGHDDAIEVGEHGGERFGLLGRMRGQLRPHPAGIDRRLHRPVGYRLPVVGDPINDCPALTAESLGIEGRQWLGGHAVILHAA